MTRAEMMNKMMNTVGLENEMTIWFCGIAEDKDVTDNAVEKAFEIAMERAFEEEEEDF